MTRKEFGLLNAIKNRTGYEKWARLYALLVRSSRFLVHNPYDAAATAAVQKTKRKSYEIIYNFRAMYAR